MGDLDSWLDEEQITQLWWNILQKKVMVKLIRPKTIKIDANYKGMTNSGYCFVEFESFEDAQQALSLNGQLLPDVAMPSQQQFPNNPDNQKKYFRLNWASGATLSAPIVQLPEYSLFVGDLSASTTEAHLLAFFQKQFPDSIKTVRVMTDPISGKSRCFGFVRFTDELERQRALDEMNGAWFAGRPLRVALATPRSNNFNRRFNHNNNHNNNNNNNNNNIHINGISHNDNYQGIGLGPGPFLQRPPNQLRTPLSGHVPPEMMFVPPPPMGPPIVPPSMGAIGAVGPPHGAGQHPPATALGPPPPSLQQPQQQQQSQQSQQSQAPISGSPIFGYYQQPGIYHSPNLSLLQDIPDSGYPNYFSPEYQQQQQQQPQQPIYSQLQRHPSFTPQMHHHHHHQQQQSQQQNSQFSDTSNTTVFVGGLSSEVTEATLFTLFKPFGTILQIKIPPGKNCGFVKYATREEAEETISAMQGFIIGGNRVRLSWGRVSMNNRRYNQRQGHGQHQSQQQQQQQQQAAQMQIAAAISMGMDPASAIAAVNANAAAAAAGGYPGTIPPPRQHSQHQIPLGNLLSGIPPPPPLLLQQQQQQQMGIPFGSNGGNPYNPYPDYQEYYQLNMTHFRTPSADELDSTDTTGLLGISTTNDRGESEYNNGNGNIEESRGLLFNTTPLKSSFDPSVAYLSKGKEISKNDKEDEREYPNDGDDDEDAGDVSEGDAPEDELVRKMKEVGINEADRGEHDKNGKEETSKSSKG